LRNIDWRKVVILVWACALAFGLAHQTAQAEAAHGPCEQACNRKCGAGNCGAAVSDGCNCDFICDDGTTGGYQCVL
jgi:hypothetical protein